MTRAEAEEYIRSCGESDGPDGDTELLTALFVALYEREPDDEDCPLAWSLCCAAVSDDARSEMQNALP